MTFLAKTAPQTQPGTGHNRLENPVQAVAVTACVNVERPLEKHKQSLRASTFPGKGFRLRW